MKVQLAGIVNESVSDGPGLRTVIFFQGCKHGCPGCHNPQTWDFKGGYQIEVAGLVSQLPVTPLIKGVTLSGGDPFYQPGAAAIIAQEYKKRGKDVWSYSGFTWEEIMLKGSSEMLNLLRNCDVLVDGPFIQSQVSFDLPYRGSSNQRLIAVQKSLASGRVVETELK